MNKNWDEYKSPYTEHGIPLEDQKKIMESAEKWAANYVDNILDPKSKKSLYDQMVSLRTFAASEGYRLALKIPEPIDPNEETNQRQWDALKEKMKQEGNYYV